MPYIKEDRRRQLVNNLDYSAENAGELNYLLTEICVEYVSHHGGRYQQINDVLGALEGCKLEFYRRLVVPYEDEKIKENGDVY